MPSARALFALALAACGAPAPPVCTPGASLACTCVDGRAGAQVCSADGAALGACVCAAPDAGPARPLLASVLQTLGDAWYLPPPT
jgi:hypothetical protein